MDIKYIFAVLFHEAELSEEMEMLGQHDRIFTDELDELDELLSINELLMQIYDDELDEQLFY